MQTVRETIGGKMKSLTALFFIFLCVAALGDQTQAGFKYGERAGNSIFDPTGVLTQKEQERISEPLKEILKNEGIDIIVVILAEIGDAPPEHVAKGFAEKWATTTVNSVVLHVPGKEGSPWIFLGEVMMESIKPESIRETISEAEKRAAAEPTDFGKVRAASIEASDAIRYWLGGALLRTEDMIQKRLEMQLARERREGLLKISAVLGAAALIPLAFGAVFITMSVRRRSARHFPPLRKIARLGAPYAGGNSNCSKPIR
jgi:hypothetical protein